MYLFEKPSLVGVVTDKFINEQYLLELLYIENAVPDILVVNEDDLNF